jgi:iron complex outermembrane receptor protein
MITKFSSIIILSCFIILLLGINRSSAQNSNKINLSGIVKQQNQPVEGITVFINAIQKTAITNSFGVYTFSDLTAGTYIIKVKLPTLKAIEKEIILTEGNQTLDFIFERALKLEEVLVVAQKNINSEIVTAGKSGIIAFDLPQSISVINNEVITNQQVNRLSDAIKNVNGVALGTSRGTTSESFFSRGYSLGNNNILRNGSRVSSAVIPEASTLESIEVLKGSAAMLYGNVSSGAVINMVTKKPKFEAGGEVSLRTGSYNLFKPIVDVYGPVSKDLAFRIVGTFEDAASFRNTVLSSRTYVNPSLLYNLGKKTSILVQGDYLKNNFNPDFGIGTLNNTVIPTNISRNSYFNTPWAFNNIEQTTASAEVNHQLNENWKLNFIGSHQNYGRDYFSTERIRANINGDWARLLTRANIKENYYTAQINFTGQVNTGQVKHQLLLGTDADQYILNSKGYGAFSVYDTINIIDPFKFTPRTDLPQSILKTDTETPTYRFGYYAQDLVSLTAKLKLLAGIRFTFQRAIQASITNLETGAITKATTTTKDDKAFSPKLGLVYQPTKITSVFASYANNFEINTGSDITGAALKPSSIDQFEIGIKNDLFKEKLSLNFSIYKIVNNDLAQQAEFAADGSPNLNALIKEFTGQTTSDGFEVDLSAKIYKQLSFIAGYSYTFMRYTKTSDKAGSFIVGEQLVRNVPHTANGTIFYTFSGDKLKGLKAGASAFYTGNRYAGFNNRKEQSEKYNRIIPVKEYTTFDFSLGYDFKKLSVLAKISNLTDVINYNVHENYSVNPIAPRQFATTISYKF